VTADLIKGLVLVLVLTATGYFVVSHSAAVLVANEPVQSDVILVLAGDREDSRFWHGMELMEKGYASRLIMDVQVSTSQFGVSNSDLAQAFVAKNAPARATVCETYADSTFGETVDVARCLQPFHASSVLIVTSAYHSRRALTIFRKRLPQYQWHVASQGGPLEPGRPWVRTADEWWKNRRWAKTILDEWQKWIWWFVVDRWRAQPVTTR
jgi:uncharacterized SAM-binding protein YcdF (DUF218 family)